MCDMCLQNPCHPRCPNAELPEVVLTCDKCGSEIFVGDAYYEDVGGENICESCMDAWTLIHQKYAEPA